MTKQSIHWIRTWAGAAALIFFAVYAISLAIGKYSIVNQWFPSHLSAFGEFLMLFLATGCFMIYAGLQPNPST